jgi:hypothetical protein
MQASGNATSEFSMSDRIKQDIENRAKARASQDAPSTPEEAIAAKVEEVQKQLDQKPAEETQAEKDKKRLKEIKDSLEKRLEMSFSEDDLSEYILKGSVNKQVTLVPGMLRGVFRTLSTAELQDIDEQMRIITAKESLTTSGLDNERALLILSKAWVGIQQKKRSEPWTGGPRPFGKTPEERADAIRKMGAMVIQYASESWTNFNTLLKIVFEEESVLKK